MISLIILNSYHCFFIFITTNLYHSHINNCKIARTLTLNWAFIFWVYRAENNNRKKNILSRGGIATIKQKTEIKSKKMFWAASSTSKANKQTVSVETKVAVRKDKTVAWAGSNYRNKPFYFILLILFFLDFFFVGSYK